MSAAVRTAPLTVVVADDNFLVRDGLRRLLLDGDELDVVGDAASAPELLSRARTLRPDAVLTDIRMPPHAGMDGVAAALTLCSELPRTGVVVLSAHADAAYADALFACGTTGLAYLLKERVADRDEIVRALLAVVAGGSVVDPLVVDALFAARRTERTDRLAALTQREREVLREMAQGLTNRAIASDLHVSESAVSKHVAAIFDKLDLVHDPAIDRRVSAALAYTARTGA